jgi:hypothetical protein
MRVRWGIALACTIAVSLAFAPARGWAQHGAPAANNKTAVTHSVTWWCVDVNDVWKVKVPAVLPIQFFVPPDPSPIPDPCRPTYLGTVPNGSSFAAGATWFTNKTYPPAVRDALQQQGYNFHGQSPAEDFMFKLADIRVEVRTYPGDVLVAERHFDPQRSFKLMRVREFFGSALEFFWGPFPWVDPDLGIDLSAEEVGRMPEFWFPVIMPPPGQPGEYRFLMYWTMSERHCDGFGVTEWDMLYPGEFLYVDFPFTVVP